MATTSRGTSTRAAILLAAICCSALAFTGCEDRPRSARLAAPASTEVAATASPAASGTVEPTPIATATSKPEARGAYVMVVDLIDGSTREVDVPDEWLDEQDRLIRVASGGTALWVWSGRSLRLESFDGTLRREWQDAASGLPESSDDGFVLLVQYAGRWHVEQGDRSTPLDVGSGLKLRLRPDGTWFGYLEPVGDRGWYRVHAVEIATGRNIALREVRACNCGIPLDLRWDATGRLLFNDFYNEKVDLGTFPGRAYAFDPRIGSTSTVDTPTGPPSPDDTIYPSQGCSVPLERSGVLAANRCLAGDEFAAAWSRDGRFVAYLRDGRLHVLDPRSPDPSRVVAEGLGSALPWTLNAIQWDASGRYLVVAAAVR